MPNTALSNVTLQDSSVDGLEPYLVGLSGLKSGDFTRLEEAHRQGYLLTKGREQRLSSVWKAKCQAAGQPFVRIRGTGRSATLYLELTRDRKRFTPRIQNALIWLSQQMPKRKMLAGSDYVICSGWPLEDLEHLAVILVPVVQGSLYGNHLPLTESNE